MLHLTIENIKLEFPPPGWLGYNEAKMKGLHSDHSYTFI